MKILKHVLFGVALLSMAACTEPSDKALADIPPTVDVMMGNTGGVSGTGGMVSMGGMTGTGGVTGGAMMGGMTGTGGGGGGGDAACLVPVTRTEIDFAADVKPIFDRLNCTGCHSNAAQGIDLSLLPGTIPDGRSQGGPSIVPCDPASSHLVIKSSGACPDLPFGGQKMPLGSPGVSAEDLAIIQQWIAEGATATFDPNACP